MTQPNPIGPARRLIAAGLIRRTPGRTLTIRVTSAGVTGSIAKSARVAELHRLCAEDYASNATRRAQTHRDDAHLIALVNEGGAAR